MKKVIIILLLPISLLSQDGAHRYFISFANRANTIFSFNAPQEYLSDKTISNRQKFGIEIDSADLPVSSLYIDNIVSNGFKFENASKWFNGIIVSTYDSLLVESLDYNFIDSIVSFGSWHDAKKIGKKWSFDNSASNFSSASNQLKMLGGDVMHANGFKGSGMIIAVIDAGFYNVDNLNVFSDLQDQILSTYDFIDNESNVYDDHTHGMMVLSTIAASGDLTGSAPDAEFILLRSENVFSENIIEEFLWVCAAEYADSSGANIINSSLGYTTFDDTVQNHTYFDMDGKTTPISRGAGIASNKGIIVVNSAGNSGSSSWHYISAPADNYDVITVGSVDENKEFSSFSSHGPNSEGMLKPNIVAQGSNTFIANANNEIIAGNGTSFSSPITAGMVACLWGANKKIFPSRIKDAIYWSADRYLSPDFQFGFGIPNYYSAYQYLNYNFSLPININNIGDLNYSIYSIDGRLIDYGSFYYNGSQDIIKLIKPQSAGIYIINLNGLDFKFNKKFIVFE